MLRRIRREVKPDVVAVIKNELYLFEDHIDDEFLEFNSYMLIQLKHSGNKYTMIHGLGPAAGVIYNEQGVAATIGESADDENEYPDTIGGQLEKWYATVTDRGENFPDNFVTPSVVGRP